MIEKSPWTDRIMTVKYIFLATKYFEMFDTIFFLLRKKESQVTNLHVVHHATVPIACWTMGKFVNTFAHCLFPILNSFVHTVMYTYYALAALGPQWQKYLWWKKYLTQMQLIQFFLLFIHALHFNFLPNSAQCN